MVGIGKSMKVTIIFVLLGVIVPAVLFFVATSIAGIQSGEEGGLVITGHPAAIGGALFLILFSVFWFFAAFFKAIGDITEAALVE